AFFALAVFGMANQSFLNGEISAIPSGELQKQDSLGVESGNIQSGEGLEPGKNHASFSRD
ncbi:MAG TPA: hypothetical protein VLA12_14335, partial [Planctomycetaceae bacterium]|nr:hypothetical protein [Planctomycetaceae bacterium]